MSHNHCRDCDTVYEDGTDHRCSLEGMREVLEGERERMGEAGMLLREADEIVQILTRGHEPSEWKASITYRSADLRKRLGAFLAKEAK